MEKIHLIGWALLLILIGSAAITATVSNEAEAQQKLGTKATFEEGKCRLFDIRKEATTSQEITANNYKIIYEFEYTEETGNKKLFYTLETPTSDKATVEAAIATACNKISETIDKVVIKPDTTEMENREYDVATKKWENTTKTIE